MIWILFAMFLVINFLFRAILGWGKTTNLKSFNSKSPKKKNASAQSKLSVPLCMIIVSLELHLVVVFNLESSYSNWNWSVFLFQGYYYALLGLFGLGLMILLTILSKKIRDYPILVASMCAGLVGNLIFIGNTDQIGMTRFTIAAVKKKFLDCSSCCISSI